MSIVGIALIFFALANDVHSILAATKNREIIISQNCTKENVKEVLEFSSIRHLTARKCNLVRLENEFFGKVNKLTNLEIIDSDVQVVEDNALQGLKYLQVLSLAHNNISVVNCWTNGTTNSLTVLDLRHNDIRHLNFRSFQCYPNLQHLNLAANLLHELHNATNTSVANIFYGLPHLKYLNLGHNLFSAITTNTFRGLYGLKQLSLQYNQITFIDPNAFQTNTHLRSLHLEGNKLVHLDFLNTHSLGRLLFLNLSYNSVDSIKNSMYAEGCELTNLDLSNNRLKILSAAGFKNLGMLESLNLSHNSLENIVNNSFNGLVNLKLLDLSANSLMNLTATHLNATKLLESIILTDNDIREVAHTLFTNSPFLRYIALADNQLSSIDFVDNFPSEFNFAELTLDMRKNRFTTLTNVSALHSFKRVELAENSWNCQWLKREMSRKSKSLNFGRSFSVATSWSNTLLNMTGIDCYDEFEKRNIIILNTSKELENRFRRTGCEPDIITPPPLTWPKVRLNKFDSRTVIIWMLVALGTAFSILRITRHILDRKESEKLLKHLKEKRLLHNISTEY